MILSAISAMSSNRVIGKDNQLVWDIPEDMAFFKSKTLGSIIIMGRKTFESMGRALPKRTNFVCTRDESFSADQVEVFASLEKAIEEAKTRAAPDEEVFIIGGEQIYRASLPFLDRIYLTRIHKKYDGDIYFPEFEDASWKLIESRESSHEGISFAFETYSRSGATNS